MNEQTPAEFVDMLDTMDLVQTGSGDRHHSGLPDQYLEEAL